MAQQPTPEFYIQISSALSNLRGYSLTVSNEPILIFDGDCAFCSSSIRLITKVIGNHPEIKPFQWTDLQTLGITQKECLNAVQFYKDNENRYSGAQAFAQFLKLSNQPWKIIGYILDLPIIKWISKVIYGIVAKNRYRLPGGTPACKLKEGD
jgi:predicted DCC family thiol-disulfide oxidoreductase YuxK